MKKLLLSLAAFAAITAGFAQNVPNRHPLIPDTEMNAISKDKSAKFGKVDVESWYSPNDWIYKDPTISSGLKNYVDFMYHDSNAKSVMMYTSGETTVYGLGQVSIAQVLDPKDDVIDYTDNPGIKLSKFVGYQLDSIAFLYRYVRNVDSISDGIGGKVPVVDTLFIHYFKGNQIAKKGLTFPGPPSRTMRYGSMGWNGGSVRMPANAFYTQTVLLTIADTTSAINFEGGFENRWTAKVMNYAAPSGMTVAPQVTDDLVAYSITFKSAVPAVIGTDTAIMIYQKDPATLPSGTRRTNYFGYALTVNEGGNDWLNPTFYNSSIHVDPISAYTPWVLNTTVSFDGFIPGLIWNSERFFGLDFYLKTNTGNVGVNEITNNNFAMSEVYPNPAHASEGAAVVFNLAKSATASFSIVNLLGQEVKAFSKNFNSGKNAEILDLNGLKAGVYNVTMTVNGTSMSKKLTIVE